MELTLLGIFIATQLADFGTTVIAIKKGGSEANPIVKAAMDRLGFFGLFLWKVWASGIMAVVYYNGLVDPFFPHLTAVMIAFYAVILINNIKVIRKLS